MRHLLLVDMFEGAIYVVVATCLLPVYIQSNKVRNGGWFQSQIPAKKKAHFVAIMFIRAQVISRGSGRNIVAAAAYRHRARMTDEQEGTTHSYRASSGELVHEELALPSDTPAWLRSAVDGRDVAGASEALWNAVDRFEKREDAQMAREIILALPEELSRSENIALVREFVADNFTARGMIADWVYHDKDGNPHVHLMTTLRPLTEEGLGPKNVPVLGVDGVPLRVVTPRRPKGQLVYRQWGGDKEALNSWKLAWADTANRHLSLAGFDVRMDGRSYAERGLGGIAQEHLGPAKAALARKNLALYYAPAALAKRQEIADRLADNPGLLLEQLSGERSTFDERDIARALHRYVDDPAVFANLRAGVMASNDLVLLKAQGLDAETGRAATPAVFTTHEMLQVEYEMAGSAVRLSEGKGFGVKDGSVDAAIRAVETFDAGKPFRFDAEQVDAVRHVTGDSGIAAVVGLAGAGKSTLMAAARLAWEADGHRVIGAALSGKAAEGLEQSSGIRSRTIASLELGWSKNRDLLQKGDVLVLDEAGMVSSAQMGRVLAAAEAAGAKIVLVGDAMQLQPIQAGAAFRAITERTGFALLSDVRRQRDVWAREATQAFARGEVESGLSVYGARGHLVEADTREAAIGKIVTDWTSARRDLAAKSGAEQSSPGQAPLSGDALLVLAHTNADVKRLNVALRSVMAAEDTLGASCSFRTAGGVREFAAGDRIIFLENARFTEDKARHLAVQHVKNGMLGTVMSSADKRGAALLSVRLDNGREVVFGENAYNHVDHGYAATIHKSQGVTADRTFVLATGMMDQHLTYVALSRHRDRADLYAAREDFEPRPAFGHAARANHAAGVTGELVETGSAKFRDDAVQPSPYADVRGDDGAVQRVWGVSLPDALQKGGANVGDTVTLRKDGVEDVVVKVPVIDAETGAKRFEERVVQRNVWTAQQDETGEARAARIEAERHQPDLFPQLVERLSRSGAKTTTLDFANEDGYRAHAADFARLRGFEQASEFAAGVEGGIARQLSWIGAQRERVASLWQRASVALGFAIERERSISYGDDRQPGLAVPVSTDGDASEKGKMLNADAARIEAAGAFGKDQGAVAVDGDHWMVAPVTSFARRLEDDARQAQLASPACKEREAILLPVLEQIYRDPAAALERLSEQASRLDIEPRRFGEDLARAPAALGIPRGGDALVDGKAARVERDKALTVAAAELIPLARAHAAAFRATEEEFRAREVRRRDFMRVGIPALSPAALSRLSEIEAIRVAGGEGAYSQAFALAAEDRGLVAQIKAADVALTARFGWKAFGNQADEGAARVVAQRLPEGLSEDGRTALSGAFAAVRRFAGAQHSAEKRDHALVVAPAAWDPATEAAPTPLLAAVTSFAVPVEEEARAKALEVPNYRQDHAELAEIAVRVWRDPAGAVARIAEQYMGGTDPDQIASSVRADPAAYGALRGSDRFMDRFGASGRERREAVEAVPAASNYARFAADAYKTALENHTSSIAADREFMGIEVPGLSREADAALTRLSALTGPGQPGKFDQAVMSLDPSIQREFKTVSRALDARFSPGAVERRDANVVNRVAATQRKAFEVMQERLRTVQRVVTTVGAQQIRAERQMRALDRGRGITM